MRGTYMPNTNYIENSQHNVIYKNWQIDCADDGEKTSFAWNNVEYQLSRVMVGECEFIIVISPKFEQGTDFIQICKNLDSATLHIEVSKPNDNGTIDKVYGKDNMLLIDVLNILRNYLDNNIKPNVDDWDLMF